MLARSQRPEGHKSFQQGCWEAIQQIDEELELLQEPVETPALSVVKAELEALSNLLAG